ncbi:MAG: hypothetical protein IKR48_06310 [Kiritimatiellae bacterium]|nr:hypothetical protein [Kiritimatiellia bacterium]
MNQNGKWKRWIWIVIGLALFFSSSDKFWEMLSRLPWIGELLSKHPKLTGWIKWVQWISGSIVTAWQTVRFVQPSKKDMPGKTETDLLDQYNIERIPLDVGKSPKLVYLSPDEYAGEKSARRAVAERLARWKKKMSDVVFLYGSRPCGRRETVCRAIPKELYPIYQIRYEGERVEDFGKVMTTVRNFAENIGRSHVTFLIRCNRTLMAKEMEVLYKECEKLKEQVADLTKIALRLVFLCTCNETLGSEYAHWAFQFETLNAQESERFLKKASALLVEKNGCADAYELAQKRYSGRQFDAAENFARGNPAELIRFLQVIAFQGESPNPLDAVQKEWQKRCRYLNLEEESLHRILAVLHLLIAFYQKGVKTVPLAQILEATFGIGRGSSEEAEIKKALGEILRMREVSLSPFEFHDVSLPDCFCNHFLFRCGKFGWEPPFHDEWQLVVDKLFTHEELRKTDYAETYCRAMVDAAIRCQLTEALPGERNPLQLYRLIDSVIRPVTFSGDEQTKKTANARREQICSELWELCAKKVTAFLADRLDILETWEVFDIVSQDLEGYVKDVGQWISRSLEYVLFLAEVEADPLCWWWNETDEHGTVKKISFLHSMRFLVDDLLQKPVPQKTIDNTWVLCGILLDLLNNTVLRPFTFSDEAEWRAYLEKVLTELEPRRSKALTVLAEKAEMFYFRTEDFALFQSIDFHEQLAEVFFLFGYVFARINECATDKDRKIAIDLVFEALRDCTGRTADALPSAVQRAIQSRRFTSAWLEAVHSQPLEPTPQKVETLFPDLQKTMDEKSAEFKLDAEKQPAFFVNVVATVVGLQARFRDNNLYRPSFEMSWKQINEAILAWRYLFTDRDWFKFMKYVQFQTQFLAPEIRAEYIRIWEAALKKIRASESGIIQIAPDELAMFLSTCTPIICDPEWSVRFQPAITDLAMTSQFPYHLNDAWKGDWMRCVLVPAVSANPYSIFFGIFSISGATPPRENHPFWELSSIKPESWAGLVTSVQWALQNAQINLSATVESLQKTQLAGYLRDWSVTIQSILVPFFDELEKRVNRELEAVVTNEALSFLLILKGEAEKAGAGGDETARIAQEFHSRLDQRFTQLTLTPDDIHEMIGIDPNDPQFLVKCLDRVEKAPQGGTMPALKLAKQQMPMILKGLQDCDTGTLEEEERRELSEMLSSWYHKIRALYEALTDDARVRGGQQWYDELMKSLQECQAFGNIYPDLYAETCEYVKRKGRQQLKG